jgi:hypothetical protein
MRSLGCCSEALRNGSCRYPRKAREEEEEEEEECAQTSDHSELKLIL